MILNFLIPGEKGKWRPVMDAICVFIPLQSDEMKKGSRFLPGKRTGPRGGDEN